MKTNITLFCLLFSLCIFSQCAVSVGQSNDSEYFPMPQGARWEYIAKSRNQPEITGKVIITIGGETVINGKTYREKIISSAGNPPLFPAKSNFYRTGADGIYIVYGILKDEFKDNSEYLLVPIPLTEKSWIVVKDKISSESKAEKIGDLKVGDTDYKDCLKITNIVTGRDYENFITAKTTTINYYSRGVGIIKSETKTEFPDGKISGNTLELEKYSLKN